MNSAQKIIKSFAILLAVLIIACIIEGILSAFQFLSWGSSSEKRSDFKETYQNVRVIDIDASASNIVIKAGQEFSVEGNNITNRFSSKNQNGTLKIQETKRKFWGSNEIGTITVTIPENQFLSKLKISAGAGEIRVNDVTADNLDLDQGAGRFQMENSIFQNTDIEGGAGEITVTNSILKNLDLDNGVGKVSLNADLLGTSNIDCGVGALFITLPNKEDYQMQVEKGLGSIEIDGEQMKNDSTYGTGKNKIDIDGGVGSIKIDFLK